ncbi:MAG: TetR/AcrR family transcriptional regulator [Kofleriaceae bacterium]|nr:MAG: TetR/AcrR family transcriptional regulator [Kofleriaceae bacterium]MBZ0237305.1 TetR/AcrR family transcriptional regulator [Kofleriaceae bacterium]
MAIIRGLRRRRRAAASGADEGGRTRRPRRRIRLENDQRRAQLLALGVQAFSERTYDDVSIDDIAKAAGISKGLLYHYFPTKRDLYLAGLRATAAELIASTTAATSNMDVPPLERMRAGLDAYLDHVSRHARPFVALMRGGIGSDPEVVGVIEGVRATYVERFLEKAEGTPLSGLLLSNRPLVRLAVRGWIGFVEAASLEWLQKQEVERTTLRDMLVDALLASLRIGSAGPSSSSRPAG